MKRSPFRSRSRPGRPGHPGPRRPRRRAAPGAVPRRVSRGTYTVTPIPAPRPRALVVEPRATAASGAFDAGVPARRELRHGERRVGIYRCYGGQRRHADRPTFTGHATPIGTDGPRDARRGRDHHGRHGPIRGRHRELHRDAPDRLGSICTTIGYLRRDASPTAGVDNRRPNAAGGSLAAEQGPHRPSSTARGAEVRGLSMTESRVRIDPAHDGDSHADPHLAQFPHFDPDASATNPPASAVVATLPRIPGRPLPAQLQPGRQLPGRRQSAGGGDGRLQRRRPAGPRGRQFLQQHREHPPGQRQRHVPAGTELRYRRSHRDPWPWATSTRTASSTS